MGYGICAGAILALVLIPSVLIAAESVIIARVLTPLLLSERR